MKALLIDYGMGNLGSACRALEECGADVRISDDPGDLADADRFVLPGVGAFPDAMACLTERGWVPKIHEALQNPLVRMLGLCLGMQLMASGSDEGQRSAGLGLIPGDVRRLEPAAGRERIPHVGWNEVRYEQPSPLFDGILSGSDFYFVHSYHFVPAAPDAIVATTPYCGGFVCAVARDNVFGVQFHPEKSGRPGLRLLRNFLEG